MLYPRSEPVPVGHERLRRLAAPLVVQILGQVLRPLRGLDLFVARKVIKPAPYLVFVLPQLLFGIYTSVLFNTQLLIELFDSHLERLNAGFIVFYLVGLRNWVDRL